MVGLSYPTINPIFRSMSTRRASQRGRRSTPPKESLLVKLLGNFLDPIDALSATFFSILFALLFTLSYGILLYNGVIDASFSSGYGTELFLAILGAVTIWGAIDGVMYALTAVFQREERHRLLQYLQTAEKEETAVDAIADELDFILEPITNDDQRYALYHDILTHLRQAEPQEVGLQREDVVGALASLLVSVLVVLPSLTPLLLLPENTAQAIQISNIISIIVIFGTGYNWGKYTETNPWKTGLILAFVCLCLVLVAILIGGY
jgi:VIT1/CCC1 family predicted Fe2+/Mn2+ transporter